MKTIKSISILIPALLLACMIPLSGTHGQQKNPAKTEINFSAKDYKQALALAKAAHKKIFVDAYASWCGPCKQLQNTTFKDDQAAAYYNKNFINFKIDIEKGEGPALFEKWNVKGLPTLLILDQNGKVLANHVGYVNGKGLVAFAKEVSGK